MSRLISYLTYRKLQRTQWLNQGAIRQLQNHKLQLLLRHAYRTVPFYREHFDSANVNPDDIQEREDLPLIPPVTKSNLQAADQEQLISSVYSTTQLKSEHTSGS